MSGFCVTTTMQSVRFLLNKWLPIYERAFAGQPVKPGRNANRSQWGRRPLTPGQREEIKARLRAGENPYSIARDYGRMESTIRYYLTKI